MDFQIINDEVSSKEEKLRKAWKKSLLIINCSLLALGNCGGPLIMRLYFLNGGEGVWISSCLETAGWPLLIIPLVFSYLSRRKQEGPEAKVFYITPRIFLASAVLGTLTGLDDFFYSNGVARVPVSTSTLIISTQLGFTAGFAFLLVKQKLTSFTINAIFMLTVGAVVLAFHSNSDRPDHESKAEYFKGFFMTLGASALYGFVLPAIELTYKKAKQTITFALVMEMQLVIAFFATLFCIIGMLFHKDFQTMSREASQFALGHTQYWVVLVFTAVFWQCFFLGAVGVIFSHSSLLSGILISGLLPLTELLAVIFYHEKFSVEKGLSLVLSIWGFISYFYGEIQENKKKKSLERL